jgi:hypothetical protein
MLVPSLDALYFSLGVLCSVAGPAASDIRDEYCRVLATPDVSRTKAMAFRALLMSAVVIFWPVLVPSAAKAVAEKRRRQEPNLFEQIDAMGQDGTHQDCVPGAVGDLGFSPANPRRADRLHTRRGSTIHDAIQRPIDIYDVRNETGALLATLFVTPCHRRNSALAPDGFRLAEAT